jgi:hypothetical protein
MHTDERRRKQPGETAERGKMQGEVSNTNGATIEGVAKFSVSLDDDLYQRVRDVAGPGGVSGWLADAALARLRADALCAVAEEIAEATGGPYTERELEEARQWLPSPSTPAR